MANELDFVFKKVNRFTLYLLSFSMFNWLTIMLKTYRITFVCAYFLNLEIKYLYDVICVSNVMYCQTAFFNGSYYNVAFNTRFLQFKNG